ncbi:NAD(P)-dependent oxidoreductase [Bacteroidota bacterium]
MNRKTRLTPIELSENFADLHPPYSRDEAITEATRCLYCYDAPCIRACPTHIDVPRFIRQILHDNVAGAGETIFESNIFGGSCARACPTEVLCEGACVDRTLLKEPVDIGRLQRYATDYVEDNGLRFFHPGTDTGFRVAVIGSGPAGLTCAHELRKRGHSVTVFEARDIPGGLNTLGIAAYKISTDFALTEVARVLDLGIELKLKTPVDGETLLQLLSDYDAVFLGIGLGQTASLSIPGENLFGVTEALNFIFQSHTGRMVDCEVGDNVIVIGAGNTAVDVATQAVRLGAERVTIAYRRTADEMSAFAYEYELAKSDGVNFLWNVQPVSFKGADGWVSAIEFNQTDAPEGAEPLIVECDMVVKALGQDPLHEFIRSRTDVADDRSNVRIDRRDGSTGLQGLFAGGDCTSGGAEIVDAVEQGKIAAGGIHDYLMSS